MPGTKRYWEDVKEGQVLDEVRVEKLTRTDLGVDFDWGVHSPFPAAPRPIRAVLSLDLPPGSYRAHWVHPRSGAIIRIENFRHAGGARNLAAPGFREDEYEPRGAEVARTNLAQ